MMIELRLQAAASVKPVRAASCKRAEQREAACAAQAKGENSGRDIERAEAAVEMMSRLKLQAAASVKPVREMSCTRAEQREAACDAQAEARAAAEMMIRLKLQAAASVKPVRAAS